MTPSAQPPVRAERPDPHAIYAAEADHVWNTLRRLGVPESDLEDQCHEVFMAAFQRLDRYDPSRPVGAWLFGFAVNVASHYRRQPRLRREVAEEVVERHDERATPEELAGAAQDRRRLFAALDTLDIDRRAVVVLHEIDGLPIPQVAETLGIPLNTAYSRLRLARANLADALREGAGAA